jgi:hypothetical protein
MTPYQELTETLDSPGMKLIIHALRKYHKGQQREYRKCRTDVDLAKVQTAQLMIDTIIPKIIEDLKNAHIHPEEKEKARKSGEWWDFWKWFITAAMKKVRR